MSTPVMQHKLSINALQSGSFGWDTSELQLDIWESDSDNHLFVRVTKDGSPIATASFRDCETQHQDSERWLNEKVGYPNPFAGILLHREWE